MHHMRVKVCDFGAEQNKMKELLPSKTKYHKSIVAVSTKESQSQYYKLFLIELI